MQSISQFGQECILDGKRCKLKKIVLEKNATNFHLMFKNNKLQILRGLKYIKSYQLKIIKKKELYEVIPLKFYVTKLVLNEQRLSSLILNYADADPQQFINSYIACKGQSFRLLSNQNIFIKGLKNNVVMIEPGSLFQTKEKKKYFCVSVLLKQKRIQVFEILNYFHIELLEQNDIKEIIDANEVLNQIQFKNLNEKKQKYFIINKKKALFLNCNEICIELLPNLFNGYNNDNNNNNNISNFNANELSGFINKSKILFVSIDYLIKHYRFKNLDPSYPKKFKDGNKLLLVKSIWTDDWESFKYSKVPNTSMYFINNKSYMTNKNQKKKPNKNKKKI